MKKIIILTVLLLLACSKDKSTEPEPESYSVTAINRSDYQAKFKLVVCPEQIIPVNSSRAIGNFGAGKHTWVTWLYIDDDPHYVPHWIMLGSGDFYLEKNVNFYIYNNSITWN